MRKKLLKIILILLATVLFLATAFVIYIKLRTTVPPMDPPPEHSYIQNAEQVDT